MQAVIAGRAGNAGLQDDAAAVAELLGKSVLAGIELGQVMDLSTAEDQGDSLRLALAAISSALIAARYKSAGQAPAEADIKKMTAALQAVLAFSENFAPDAQNTARLSNLEAIGQGANAHQAAVQYIQALTPVVNAVSAFPFGQPEQKLIMEISGRLTQKASAIAGALPGAPSGDEKKSAELAVLRALAQIYGAAHEAETARISGLSEEARAQQSAAAQSMDGVWKSFDERVMILEALAQSMVPGMKSTSSSSSGSGAAPAKPAPATQASAPPAAPPSAPPGGNPMSMFVKKPEGGEPPPPQETPQAAPPEPPPQAPPPKQEAPPPSGDNGGKSPMSFFKPGAKKDDEE